MYLEQVTSEPVLFALASADSAWPVCGILYLNVAHALLSLNSVATPGWEADHVGEEPVENHCSQECLGRRVGNNGRDSPAMTVIATKFPAA
jgi:hypothetical protein